MVITTAPDYRKKRRVKNHPFYSKDKEVIKGDVIVQSERERERGNGNDRENPNNKISFVFVAGQRRHRIRQTIGKVSTVGKAEAETAVTSRKNNRVITVKK